MNNKILVVNGPSYALPLKDLGEIVTNISTFLENPGDFKLVLFTGGEDITPSWYGETSPDHMCHYNERRDEEEAIVFKLAERRGIPMMGICRGIQFLNVMHGGRIFHNVTNHAGPRHMMTLGDGEEFVVNSLHHQMVIPPVDAVPIAWSSKRRSTTYIGDKDLEVVPPPIEVEAVAYPRTKSVGVQYHPEMMDVDSRGFLWFKELATALLTDTGFAEIVKKYAPVTECPKQNMHRP